MAALGGAGQASSYYTKDNYYTSEDAREASEWTGEGARQLGLQGNVELDPFAAALEGRLPDGTEIAAGPGGKHRPGIDITFSASKSVSLLALVGGDERLREVELKAVKQTIAWAEKQFAETRMQGRDGKMTTVKTGNLVVALFAHDTNRNLDPQAYVHAVIANATRGPDGKWRALHNDKLWTGKTAMASVYNAYLRSEVEKLGYTTELSDKHGQFEISGIPREAIMAFSTRRKEVLEAFVQLTHQNDRTRDAVTIKTRRRKATVENRQELRAEWTARAAEAGLDLPAMVAAARERSLGEKSIWDRVAGTARDSLQRGALVAAHVRDRLGGMAQDPLLSDRLWKMRPTEIAAAAAVASAIRHLSERETSFTTLKLAKAALDLGLPITIEDVERRVGVLKREGKLLAGQGERRDELTTVGAALEERRLIELVEAGRDRGVQVIASPEEAGKRLQAAAEQRQGFKLNIGQEAAGRLLLAATDRIVNVQGVAGAGKSSMLSAVADVAREEGRNVIGLGLQNTLVRMLERDTGIASMTIARFLGSHGRLLEPGASPQRLATARAMFSGAVVLVDEASMVSNDQALKLAALAETLQLGRLAFVGDKRQLGAIDAGKPFEVLQAAGAKTAQMNINLRARSPALVSAAAAANDYRPRDALAALKPLTTEAPGQGAAVAAARWLALPVETREQTMLLASGRQVRADINANVQQGLREQGVLKGGGSRSTCSTR